MVVLFVMAHHCTLVMCILLYNCRDWGKAPEAHLGQKAMLSGKKQNEALATGHGRERIVAECLCPYTHPQSYLQFPRKSSLPLMKSPELSKPAIPIMIGKK